MKRKQAEKEETAGNRVRLSVYMSKDVADELNGILEQMPFRVSMSGFIETAVKDAIVRVKAEGIKFQLTPRK